MRTVRADVSFAIAVAAGLFALGSCGGGPRDEEDPAGNGTEAGAAPESSSAGESEVDDSGGGLRLDVGDMVPDPCGGDGAGCDKIDLLFVIDNSGTMGEEQRNLAANLPMLVEQLQNLTDREGNPIHPDVNIMVTTTDLGHPLCTQYQKPDYEPRRGAPVYDGCNGRIQRFTGLDPMDPLEVPEACTQNCPADIAPGDQFIHFDVQGSNVPNDDVAAALSCIGPQGIDGCGYESTLEAMLQAIDPSACWNDPEAPHCQDDPEWGQFERPFLRDDATLAIAIITDEADCSVVSPDGYSYFTDLDRNEYWAVDPELDEPQASSAICWNAGVDCDDTDGDGTYETCTSSDSPALHSIERYVTYLKFLREQQHKEVIMLGILGVPPVTEHSDQPPYQPTAGGIFDLVYRDWRDGEYDGTPEGGDILPEEYAAGVTVDQKRFEFGPIGPGCTGGEAGMYTGQAIPPVRVKEVCQSLDYTDQDGVEQVRCCIESICDDDFSPAMRCLTGIIADTIAPAG